MDHEPATRNSDKRYNALAPTCNIESDKRYNESDKRYNETDKRYHDFTPTYNIESDNRYNDFAPTCNIDSDKRHNESDNRYNQANDTTNARHGQYCCCTLANCDAETCDNQAEAPKYLHVVLNRCTKNKPAIQQIWIVTIQHDTTRYNRFWILLYRVVSLTIQQRYNNDTTPIRHKVGRVAPTTRHGSSAVLHAKAVLCLLVYHL